MLLRELDLDPRRRRRAIHRSRSIGKGAHHVIDDHNHADRIAREAARSARSVDAVRLSVSDTPPSGERCDIVVEQPLSITIDDVGTYTLMCTPCDTMSLAVGFAFTEGIIGGTRDIKLLHRCDDDPGGSIRIQLANVPEELHERNLIVISSCGMCGSPNVEETLAALPRCSNTLRVGVSLLLDVLAKMKAHQRIFGATGAAHAAAIFTPDAEIVSFAEDIGRHNALDKAIGTCLLEDTPTRGCGVALSGRVSLDMVAKAAMAGIELITAVSAPSSLALEAAQRCDITLCGFVRADRATVYSHRQRIKELRSNGS